MRRCIK